MTRQLQCGLAAATAEGSTQGPRRLPPVEECLREAEGGKGPGSAGLCQPCTAQPLKAMEIKSRKEAPESMWSYDSNGGLQKSAIVKNRAYGCEAILAAKILPVAELLKYPAKQQLLGEAG